MLRRRPDYEYAKGLVEAYFTIMTRGCGSSDCTNGYCKSNPRGRRFSPNEAAAQALVLAIEAPMPICLLPLRIEVGPETNDDDVCASPSTPRKRLETAVRLDTSINSPKRVPTKRPPLVRPASNHAEETTK
ncbi:hypothetical protein ACHHYP_10137 [Achlya hypogyna]|uniref:Ubiquitin-protein ligase E3A N-terminal zinc-binding domain-containing protein n=1 Tax=Achlya hypogyna TaxID=1202772 RepID=A0A1V9ZI27_ACHHY|nr:hypothetical protein ACHHYP_10137 [Achlya hypogyna]